jgi:UDP-N-acetylmuramoylalanine--D-glutamate ligase
MENYVNSKKNIFSHQTANDIAIYYADNKTSASLAQFSPGVKIPFSIAPGAYVQDEHIVINSKQLCRVDELNLPGKHNLQNVCAAVTTVWQVTQNTDTIRSVLTTFASLPHRIEFVREVNDVRYYNDSFASVMEATQAAVEAVPGKKVLVLGGYDRMLPLEGFTKFLKDHETDIATMLLIGQSAQRLAKNLDAADMKGYHLSGATTMHELVLEAKKLAKPGEAVVLSPGFASFDMFKNFEDRGKQFKQEVMAL